MTKKKKKTIDDYDFEDEPTALDLQNEPEVAKISLRDFVVEQKVSAFVSGYAPCKEGDSGYEQFDDARLREIFKAYVCGLGDPLKLYLDDLQMAGFRMECSMLTGEPCIFARRK